MEKRQSYPSDLTDAEWAILDPLIPAVKSGGRPAEHDHREIVNAIFYVLRTGCQWRALPHDLPPWKTVYTYFRVWRLDGTWRRIHDTLRRQVRRSIDKQVMWFSAVNGQVKRGVRRRWVWIRGQRVDGDEIVSSGDE